MIDVKIRPEAASDIAAIRDLTIDVFYEAYGTGQAEATLIEELCQQNESYICLVAEYNNSVIGYIVFSSVKLVEFPDIPACVLGPLGVRRDCQKQGIGSRLIHQGLKECKQLGYQAVFTTGSLEYYPRFGFLPIAPTNLHTIFKSEHDMVLELQPGLLKLVSGLVDYPKPWHVFL
ncbi:MAG: GNAT family N-acetyltransferase [Planctomycetota bacterium]